MNKANGYCVSAGSQSCGRWANCNKSQAQTRQNNMILNVFAEPCDSRNVNQQWTLDLAPNATLIEFTPLNVSANRYAIPIDDLAAQASSNSRQVGNRLYFVISAIRPLCFVSVVSILRTPLVEDGRPN